MDASNKKVALIAETVQGTTPATPTFLILRDMKTEGNLQRPWSELPERRNDAMLASTVKGLNSLNKKITLPFIHHAALDILLASALRGPWATNVLANGNALQSFTLEEVFAASTGTPGPWLRSLGCVVDQMTLTLQNGQPGQFVFDLIGMTEPALGSVAITGATYTAPAADEPITPIDALVNTFFGITTAKLMNMTLTLKNNIRQNYGWGSPDIFRTGPGSFRVQVKAEFYFSAAAEYNTILPGALGALDITFGSLANNKYELILPNAKISAPVLSDGGNDNDVTVSCTMDALFDSGTSAAMKILRLVA